MPKQPLIVASRPLLWALRNETAAELGLQDLDLMDKGNLPSKVFGHLGGNMTRKLIALAEQELAKQNPKS